MRINESESDDAALMIACAECGDLMRTRRTHTPGTESRILTHLCRRCADDYEPEPLTLRRSKHENPQ